MNDQLVIFFKFGQEIVEKKIDNEKWRRLHTSINNKWDSVGFLGKDVIDQIPNLVKDEEELQSKGSTSLTQRKLLLTKYKAFLNEIYAICENLACLGYVMIPDMNKRTYNEQLTKIKNNPNLSSQYAKILKENQWYEKMHIMRSENTHFFEGEMYINENKKPGIIFKNLINRRSGVTRSTEIDVHDIEDDVNNLIQGVNSYIENLIPFLFSFVEDRYYMFDHCWMQFPGQKGYRVFGPRRQSFIDFREGKKWECISSYPCPLKGKCPYT